LSWTVNYIPTAYRALKKLPKEEARRIISKIEALTKNPYPHSSKKLGGKYELWRLRAGNYRIVYRPDEESKEILIVKIAHRKDVYKNL